MNKGRVTMTKDDMFEDAAKIVFDANRGSVSLLQRRLSIGYARASRILDQLVAVGICGEYKGHAVREVIMIADEYANLTS